MKLTKEEVQKLQEQQDNPRYHPYTCCSYDGCERDKQPNWGALIPTEDCWVCPCGTYKQKYNNTI